MSTKKTTREYLEDMHSYLNKIAAFTREGQQAFMNDEKTQMAVIRADEVIGEIVKRLPEALRDQNPQVDWRKLAGFRDFLSHNYDEIILAFVWAAVEDVPSLASKGQALISAVPEDE